MQQKYTSVLRARIVTSEFPEGRFEMTEWLLYSLLVIFGIIGAVAAFIAVWLETKYQIARRRYRREFNSSSKQ